VSVAQAGVNRAPVSMRFVWSDPCVPALPGAGLARLPAIVESFTRRDGVTTG
jgi:hypothetical protein